MKIISGEKIGQKKWDEFIKKNSFDFGLLQSWQWGEFQKSLRRKVFRLAVVNNNEILAVASVIKMSLKLGKSYFYISRGPAVVKTQKHKNIKIIYNLLFEEIKKIAEKEAVIFLRVENVSHLFLNKNKEKKVADPFFTVQPRQTLILDLDKSEEELLKQMKSKTRYNIKVAKKHGVAIEVSQRSVSMSAFQDFWRLIEKTSSRQEIKPHPKEYYQKMLEVLAPQGILKLITAKYQDKIIAANLVVFFGNWCVYLHGASDYKYRKVMAPFLLQWETIKLAKKQGRKYYDFWGADEKKWPGVTRFKKGFAPQKEFTEYAGIYDLVYKGVWYNIYKIVKKIF